MNLTPELQGFVQSLIASGDFNNSSEVHRAALAAMKKREEEYQARLARLRGEIQKGLDSMEDGGSLIETESELKAAIGRSGKEARKRLEAKGVPIAP